MYDGNVYINTDKLLDEVFGDVFGGILNENSLETSQSTNSRNRDENKKVTPMKKRSEIFGPNYGLYFQNLGKGGII